MRIKLSEKYQNERTRKQEKIPNSGEISTYFFRKRY